MPSSTGPVALSRWFLSLNWFAALWIGLLLSIHFIFWKHLLACGFSFAIFILIWLDWFHPRNVSMASVLVRNHCFDYLICFLRSRIQPDTFNYLLCLSEGLTTQCFKTLRIRALIPFFWMRFLRPNLLMTCWSSPPGSISSFETSFVCWCSFFQWMPALASWSI